MMLTDSRIRIFRTMVILLAVRCPLTSGEDRPCKTMEVKDTSYQMFREGDYELQDNLFCEQRVVYKSSSNGYYIFFLDLTTYQGWVIGPQQCQNLVGMTAEDSATYPQDVTNFWTEFNGASFVSTSAKVQCKTNSLSALAITGIVLGGLLGLVLIVVIIFYLCKGSHHKCNCCSSGQVEPDNNCPSQMNGQWHPTVPPPYTANVPSYRAFVVASHEEGEEERAQDGTPPTTAQLQEGEGAGRRGGRVNTRRQFVYSTSGMNNPAAGSSQGRTSNSVNPGSYLTEMTPVSGTNPTASAPPRYEDALGHDIYTGPQQSESISGRLRPARDIISPPPAYEPMTTSHQ